MYSGKFRKIHKKTPEMEHSLGAIFTKYFRETFYRTPSKLPVIVHIRSDTHMTSTFRVGEGVRQNKKSSDLRDGG